MSGLAQASPIRRVLLCGYYGEHNLGDDALLEVLIRQLPSTWQPVITGHDSEAVRRIVPNAVVVNRRSLKTIIRSISKVQVVVLGGGSLLQDSTSVRSLIYYLIVILAARVNRKTVVLWGQGLGPLKHSFSRFLVRRSLNYPSFITWRDDASMDLARWLGVKRSMSVAPDPVWNYPMHPHQGGGNIVLCWRPTSLLSDRGWSILLQAVDKLCKETGLSVTWLAFHGQQDVDLLSSLCSRGLVTETLAKQSSTVIAKDIQHVQAIFCEASLVIAMRLHALILSMISQCPTSALSYDPKVEAAARTAGAPWSDLNELPDREALFNQWRRCLLKPPSLVMLESIRTKSMEHERVLKMALRMSD